MLKKVKTCSQTFFIGAANYLKNPTNFNNFFPGKFLILKIQTFRGGPKTRCS